MRGFANWTPEQRQAAREKSAATRRANKGNRTPAAQRETAAQTHTPIDRDGTEFKAAVAEGVNAAVTELVPKLLAQLLDARATLGGEPAQQAGDQFWADKLSLSIAQLTDPGRQLVAPEVIEARKKAGARMMQLLVEVRAKGIKPIYTLTSKIVVPIEGCGETLIDPLQRGQDNRVYATRIRWDQVPNLAMEPTEEWSEKISRAFRESIGNGAPDDGGDLAGKPKPPSGGYVETGYVLTSQNHAITGLSAAQIASRDHQGPMQRPGMGTLIDESGATVQQNGGGPPYVDVRVLGTISPPARQNG
jgi:hypothetical protein